MFVVIVIVLISVIIVIGTYNSIVVYVNTILKLLLLLFGVVFVDFISIK